jgi:methylmalonyl-CoA/ethylmalonyl-CoA epimerase
LVEDIQQAVAFWRDGLGMEVSHQQDVPTEQARIAFLPVGDSEIELVQPTTDDSGLRRYLEKRGPGMHHVCLQVDDIEAMLARLKARGIELINEAPRTSADGKKYAFIHPRSAGGVMVELYELP